LQICLFSLKRFLHLLLFKLQKAIMAKGKFIEGQIYEFKYLKRISLDEDFFVFEDFSGERYLLPIYHYKNYHFKPNSPINCLVTRIDCAGKVSFEPEHPYYKLGTSYKFKFKELLISKEENYDKYSGSTKKKKVYELIVLDNYDNEHSVAPHEWQKKKNYKPENILCRVQKIINGTFQLLNEESKPQKKKLRFFN